MTTRRNIALASLHTAYGLSLADLDKRLGSSPWLDEPLSEEAVRWIAATVPATTWLTLLHAASPERETHAMDDLV